MGTRTDIQKILIVGSESTRVSSGHGFSRAVASERAALAAEVCPFPNGTDA
jgi:hypothetical protein